MYLTKFYENNGFIQQYINIYIIFLLILLVTNWNFYRVQLSTLCSVYTLSEIDIKMKLFGILYVSVFIGA